MGVDISLQSHRGESAGVPRLVLNFSAKNTGAETLVILGGVAEVRAANAMIVPDMGKSSCFAGYAVLELGGGPLPQGSEQMWTLGLAVEPYSLRKVEETRKGGDLFLHIQFFCKAAKTEPSGMAPLFGAAPLEVRASGSSSNYCPFKIAQSDWEKTLKELGASDLSNAEQQIRQDRNRAQKALLEIEGLSAKAKEAAAIVGVAGHASYFNDEAADHKKASRYWLVFTIIFAIGAAGYSLWSFHQIASTPAEGAVAWWPHLTYLTSRLIVLSVIFFGMGWAAKNYRAHKHNEIVNRHRQNALKTFETFARAADDKATKDAVLLEATKSIFGAQSTGYLSGEAEKVPSGTVIEVLGKAISTREPS